MLTFPPAAPSDAPVIAAMRQRCWAATCRGVYPDGMIDDFDHAWHTERDRKRITDSRHTVHLIEQDGQPIGYIILFLGQAPLLMSLYILPEYHRQGIGRAAFTFIRERFRSLGHSSFTCHCLPQNTAARAFYEHMGGILCGEGADNPEPWQNSVIYLFEC